ncbi:Uncharacterised protein [Pseudescherichia vulneris]|nr:Uncharacterised protein [Pseudescherichia vulneris]
MLFFLSTLCILRGELPFSAFRKPGTTFALESMANATDRFQASPERLFITIISPHRMHYEKDDDRQPGWPPVRCLLL